MRKIFRATAILSSSSMITIVMGVIATKAWSVLLGPSHYGLMGLYQNLLNMLILGAGLGIGNGLVQFGAAALSHQDLIQVAALRRAAFYITSTLVVFAILVLVLFRESISLLTLGDSHYSLTVLPIGFALLFTLLSTNQICTLNAYHRVGKLARTSILSNLLSTCVSLALIWRWRERGIAPAILAGSFMNLMISTWFVRQDSEIAQTQNPKGNPKEATRKLLRFGVPYAASQIAGTGVQLSLPIFALHFLGSENVGYYRAATAISSTYLGFLITAMSQDYYPRIAAASDQPEALVGLINQQHQLVMLLSIPLILGVLALAPYLVPLIYSSHFLPTIDVLEWQLLGDLFRFASWTSSYVILARCGSSAFFWTELTGGAGALIFNWFGMKWFGLEGLGIAFLASYLFYYFLVWGVLRLQGIPLSWSPRNKAIIIGGVTSGLIIRLLPYLGLLHLRLALGLIFSLGAGAISLVLLRSEMRKV